MKHGHILKETDLAMMHSLKHLRTAAPTFLPQFNKSFLTDPPPCNVVLLLPGKHINMRPNKRFFMVLGQLECIRIWEFLSAAMYINDGVGEWTSGAETRMMHVQKP